MVFRVKRVTNTGETIHGKSFDKNIGSKGANQAVAAVKLGGDVVMVGRVENDSFGELQVSAFDKEKIDTSCIFDDSSISTGVVSIWVE